MLRLADIFELMCARKKFVNNTPAQNQITINLPQRVDSQSYSSETIATAIALHSTGLTWAEIARQTNVKAPSTVRNWVQGVHRESDIESEALLSVATEIKNSLSSKLLVDASRLFNLAMSPEKIEKSSTLQLVTAGSILFDKHRLLAGESTSNTSIIVKNVSRASERVAELESSTKMMDDEIKAIEASEPS